MINVKDNSTDEVTGNSIRHLEERCGVHGLKYKFKMKTKNEIRGCSVHKE